MANNQITELSELAVLCDKDMRLNAQFLYLDRSPVGYSSVSFTVGGDGWVFSTDAIISF